MLAVIYARVSSMDQLKKGYSMPEQLKECRAKAKTLGATEFLEFSEAFDGDFLDRPALNAARDAVRRGGVRWFVCYDPDRFSRVLMNQLIVTDEIERNRADLVFVQHDYQRTPEGQLFYQMRGAISQFEKAKIKERTDRGRRGKLAAGKPTHGISPYGYSFDPATDSLVINEPEADVVRMMFGWAADGVGPVEIARRLMDQGIPAQRGQKWYRAQVSSLLKNTSYIGQVACHRWVTTATKRKLNLETRQRPKEDWVFISAPPIVDEAVFNQVQHNRRRFGRTQKGKYLLSGLAVCGLCGQSMHYVHHQRGHTCLRCLNRYPQDSERREMPEPCKAPTQRAAIFEDAVWVKVRSWFLDPEEHAAYIDEFQSRPDTDKKDALESERTRWSAALDEARKEQALTISLMSKSLLDEEAGEAKLLETKKRIDAIRQELHRITQELDDIGRAVVSVESALDSAQTHLTVVEGSRSVLADRLDQWTLEQRQDGVRKLVDSVVIYPGQRYVIYPRS